MPNQELLKTELPQIVTISDAVKEAENVKTFFFDYKIDCKPGQFIMMWIPNVDEKPMAVSYLKKDSFGITCNAVGSFTNTLNKLKKNDKVGIRGPYGNGFTIKENACVVGGGMGMASVATLIDALKNLVIINGARSKKNLIYLNRYKNIIITTDDGSLGRKGFTTDALESVLRNKKDIKVVYTCGPELMMKRVLEVCNKYKVECQASLERYMKCGYGICGNCAIDSKLVCIDGPIFNSKELNKMKEFGNFARLKSGRKVSIKEYYSANQ